MRALIHTAKTDALHKIRSQSFLVMLLAMTILAMLFFPQVNAPYQTLMLGEFRGIYNSAWIGHSLAMLNVSFLPLILFYYLRGAMQRDSASFRGEIFAATPLNNFDYLMGKALSNFAVALMIIAWMTLIAVLMQLWIGEDRNIDLLNLLLPQLIHVAPMLLFISMMTLVFDALPFLRSSAGNVAYFFLASAGLVLISYDATGINFIVEQMKAHIFDSNGIVIESINIGITAVAEDAQIKSFAWKGISYKEYPFTSIAYILASSVVLFMIALLSFKRTSLTASNTAVNDSTRFKKLTSISSGLTQYLHKIVRTLTAKNVFSNLVRLEFLLLIGNKSNYLWLGLLALWIAQWFVSSSILFIAVLPGVMLLAALVLSTLGQREKSHGTQDFLINAPLLMKVQYPAMLVAGIVFLISVSLPSLVRLLVVEEFYSCILLLAGYFCIVSAAILLGTISRTNKMFEIIFVIIWYIGPISRFTYFDFIGVDRQLSENVNAVVIFTSVGLLFNLLGLAIRKSTLR